MPRGYGGRAKKYAKKVVKATGKQLKRRYFKKATPSLNNLRINQVAKDVAVLQSLVNAEKKRVEEPSDQIYTVGQLGLNLNSSGFIIKRAVFEMPEGTGHRERNGNSIKCHSYHMDIRVKSLNSINMNRMKFYLVKMREPQQHTTINDIVSKFLLPSAFNGKYDYMSPRNYEHYNDFEVIGMKNIYLKPDSITNETPSVVTSIGGKLNFHQRIRETAGTYTNYDLNELFVLAVCERGNTVTPSEELTLEFTGTMYYYDN